MSGTIRPYQAFAELAIHSVERRVDLTRNAEPFASLDELREFWRGARELVRHLPAGEYGVLTDLREVTGRTDDEFERLMMELRGPFYDVFRRSAIVVRTRAGQLHVFGQSEANRPPTGVFYEMGQALDWLAGHDD